MKRLLAELASYYNFRYYIPELARFAQADDLIPDFADPQSYNRYSYVMNNPLRFTDPTGHDLQDYIPVYGPWRASYTGQEALNATAVRLGENRGGGHLYGNYQEAAAALNIGGAGKATVGNMSDVAAAGDFAAGATSAYANSVTDIAGLGVKTAAVGAVGLITKRATLADNMANGARREAETAVELTAGNSGKAVQSQRTLLNTEGNKVVDPITGTGRRVDHAVIDREANTAKTFETTGPNVNKTGQMRKEKRIREAGGTFIRDKETRQLVPVSGTSEVIRKP